MRCGKVIRLLSDHLDNTIAYKLKIKVDKHLHRCASCSRFLRELRQTAKLLNILNEKKGESPSPDYWVDYWANLREKLPKDTYLPYRKPANIRVVPRFGWALQTAVAILLIANLAAVLMTRKQPVIHDIIPFASVIREVKLFREVQEMFPDTVEYMLINHDAIDLKISQNPLLSVNPPVIFEFKVFSFSPGSDTQLISSPRMVIFEGKETEIIFQDKFKDSSIAYRYRILPEATGRGMYLAKIDFSLLSGREEGKRKCADPVGVNTFASLKEKQPHEIARLKADGREYLLYCTVYSGDEKTSVRDSGNVI